MQFPNAYKGIKKIFLGEIMAVAVVVLTVVGAVVLTAYGVGTDAGLADLTREQALTIGGLSLGLLLAAAVIALAGLILNFMGVVQAKKDDSHFNTAFFTALLTLVIGVITSFLSRNAPEIQRWAGLGGSVCGIIARFFILSGIASLAEKMVDGKVKAMAEKARVIVCAVFIVSNLAGLISDYLPDAVSLEILGYALSIGSSLYYLTVLAKAKKMLAV